MSIQVRSEVQRGLVKEARQSELPNFGLCCTRTDILSLTVFFFGRRLEQVWSWSAVKENGNTKLSKMKFHQTFHRISVGSPLQTTINLFLRQTMKPLDWLRDIEMLFPLKVSVLPSPRRSPPYSIQCSPYRNLSDLVMTRHSSWPISLVYAFPQTFEA